MSVCLVEKGDYIEFLVEVDVLMGLSICFGGDLSFWGFGVDSEKEMEKCCWLLKVEVFWLEDGGLLEWEGWRKVEVSGYKGGYGFGV